MLPTPGGEGAAHSLSVAPNPATDMVAIQYELTANARVQLALYNALGEKLAIVEEGQRKAGVQSVQWNVHGFASGTYWARLVVDGVAIQIPFVVVR